ncbi:MAG TPA: hypothetical protein VGB26_01640 [Nitrospiria bacterium]
MNSAKTNQLSFNIRLNLGLTTKAVDLSCEELLRISEVAEEAKAAVHISHQSWQVFLGVPIQSFPVLRMTLGNMGFPCFQIEEGFKEHPTIRLKLEQS